MAKKGQMAVSGTHFGTDKNARRVDLVTEGRLRNEDLTSKKQHLLIAAVSRPGYQRHLDCLLANPTLPQATLDALIASPIPKVAKTALKARRESQTTSFETPAFYFGD